jgi:hypothetical protein
MIIQFRHFAASTALVLALAACQQGEPDAQSSPSGETALADASPQATDAGQPSLTLEAEKGEEGARNVLLAWARGIEFKRFDEAWDLFGEAGRERISEAEFAAMFEGLGEIAVAISAGEMEGAAGSLYYTSQATITGTDAEGRPIRIEGPVVLRRVNDVPGASEEQLRWHIESADLTWTH